MNKLLILAKNYHTFFIERLMTEALVGSIQLINPWEEKKSPVGEGRILVRSTAIHGSSDDLSYIEQYKLTTIPPLAALKSLRTKPLQFEYFRKNNLNHLPWLNLDRVSREEIENFAADKGKLLIKPQRGQGGWGVRVFEHCQELLSWWGESEDVEYLLQPYIEDHQEIRVFFMGKTFIAFKRMKEGVAANFRQDGVAQEIAVPRELQEVVEFISRDLGLLYGAADFLISESPKGTTYLLEMNLVPGIEQLEQVSGRNIARELLEIFAQS